MTSHSAVMEGSATIGEVLRETRMNRGLDLVAVAKETKISPKNLQAMEEGDLASLPAEVYTRGFYTMYARLLALDPGEVLELYSKERKHLPKSAMPATPPPHRLAEDVASMAERPNSQPSSYFGLIIFLFLLFGGFLCWYFGWNPASYLSEKLRSLDGPQQFEQVRIEPEPQSPLSVPAKTGQSTATSFNLFSPTNVTAAMTQPEDAITSAAKTDLIVNAAPPPPVNVMTRQLPADGGSTTPLSTLEDLQD